LLFHPSFFHLEIPAGLLEHVGERGVFFHLPISDDVWLFFFSPFISYTTGVVGSNGPGQTADASSSSFLLEKYHRLNIQKTPREDGKQCEIKPE
jgi:hypothetical protein